MLWVPPVQADVVEEFEIAVVAKREQRRIAHGGELSAEGDLREAHVERVRGHALQARAGRRTVAGVRAGLAAGDGQKSESRFIQEFGEKTWVQPATPFKVWVLRLRPKPGSRLSCRTPDPNGIELRAHRRAKSRRKAVSCAENW